MIINGQLVPYGPEDERVYVQNSTGKIVDAGQISIEYDAYQGASWIFWKGGKENGFRAGEALLPEVWGSIKDRVSYIQLVRGTKVLRRIAVSKAKEEGTWVETPQGLRFMIPIKNLDGSFVWDEYEFVPKEEPVDVQP